MKIQVTVSQLEAIIKAAIASKSRDNTMSLTLEIEQTSKSPNHLQADMIGVIQKTEIEGNVGKSIYWNSY
jgi:hypothetical protein